MRTSGVPHFAEPKILHTDSINGFANQTPHSTAKPHRPYRFCDGSYGDAKFRTSAPQNLVDSNKALPPKNLFSSDFVLMDEDSPPKFELTQEPEPKPEPECIPEPEPETNLGGEVPNANFQNVGDNFGITVLPTTEIDDLPRQSFQSLCEQLSNLLEEGYRNDPDFVQYMENDFIPFICARRMRKINLHQLQRASKWCINWVRHKTCRFRNKCHFAHHFEEFRPMPCVNDANCSEK